MKKIDSKFNRFYKSVVKEDVDYSDIPVNQPINRFPEVSPTPVPMADSIPPEEYIANQQPEPGKKEEEVNVETMQDEFIAKIIRFTEISVLLEKLPEIVNDFKAIKGINMPAVEDGINAKMAALKQEKEELEVELNETRNTINKFAEQLETQQSIIAILDKESKIKTASTTPSQPAAPKKAKSVSKAAPKDKVADVCPDCGEEPCVCEPEDGDQKPAKKQPKMTKRNIIVNCKNNK